MTQTTPVRVVTLDENRAVIRTPYGDRHFWAPWNGGYIYEVTAGRPGTTGRQVCEYLSGKGNTLDWFPRNGGTVADVLRRELRRIGRATYLEEEATIFDY